MSKTPTKVPPGALPVANAANLTPGKQKDLPGVPPTIDGKIDSLMIHVDHARAALVTLAREADGSMPIVIVANGFTIAAKLDKLIGQLDALRPE